MNRDALLHAVMGAPSAAYSTPLFGALLEEGLHRKSFAPFTIRLLSLQGVRGYCFPVIEYNGILS